MIKRAMPSAVPNTTNASSGLISITKNIDMEAL